MCFSASKTGIIGGVADPFTTLAPAPFSSTRCWPPIGPALGRHHNSRRRRQPRVWQPLAAWMRPVAAFSTGPSVSKSRCSTPPPPRPRETQPWLAVTRRWRQWRRRYAAEMSAIRQSALAAASFSGKGCGNPSPWLVWAAICTAARKRLPGKFSLPPPY